MSQQSEQERAFEAWKLKQSNTELAVASFKSAHDELTKVLRIVTKYDNLLLDIIDGNKQYVHESCMNSELTLCVRLLCRTLDTLFE